MLKFRMLVLQAMHGLSLDQTEYLVSDRLSWMRFCGWGPATRCRMPIRLGLSEALVAAGAIDALFARLDRAITEAGYLPMSGQIVDATLVAAPRCPSSLNPLYCSILKLRDRFTRCWQRHLQM